MSKKDQNTAGTSSISYGLLAQWAGSFPAPHTITVLIAVTTLKATAFLAPVPRQMDLNRYSTEIKTLPKKGLARALSKHVLDENEHIAPERWTGPARGRRLQHQKHARERHGERDEFGGR